jgi:GT2 family glycosyltransferase
MPKVSILTINYNGEGITIDCLKSLEKQTFNDFEIIIVDNASIDDSINSITNYLKKSGLAPFTQIISANRNLGFAGGNIEGLKYTNGEYIALLNNNRG